MGALSACTDEEIDTSNNASAQIFFIENMIVQAREKEPGLYHLRFGSNTRYLGLRGNSKNCTSHKNIRRHEQPWMKSSIDYFI
ncbi:hypothetical protein UNDKW_2735 [Undibacterium sp. KW1]|nr:hypothetical protein UNDKW_2735 [Undibacterium sp. KW1]